MFESGFEHGELAGDYPFSPPLSNAGADRHRFGGSDRRLQYLTQLPY